VYRCRFCGAEFTDAMEVGRHIQKEHQRELKEERARKGEAPRRREDLYKGEPDAMGILRDILERHPDISERVKDEIMDWAGLQGYLSPQTLAYLLGQMRGVTPQTANIVAQKYALALQRAQLEGRPGIQMPIMPQLQPLQAPLQPPLGGYQPYQPQTYPQVPPAQALPPHQPYQPYTQPPQPPPQFRPKVYKLVVDGQEIETDEAGFRAWKEYLDRRERTEGGPRESLTREDLEEILERKRAKEERESLADVIKNLPKLITEAISKSKKEEELPERIARAVAEAVPKAPATPPAPSITREDLLSALKESSEATRESLMKLIEAKEKEDAANRRHQELLSAIRSAVAAREVSGYKEDSYRLLGQGLSSLASAVERKEPVRIVLERAPDLLYGPAPPGPKEIAPGATGREMAAKIRPEWIAEE